MGKNPQGGIMKYLLCIALLVGLPLTGFAKGDAVAGKAKYDLFCVACHGATGKGDGPAGAALNPKPADFAATKLADADLFKIIKEGGAAVGRSAMMISWKASLTDDDINNVIAYIRALKPSKK